MNPHCDVVGIKVPGNCQSPQAARRGLWDRAETCMEPRLKQRWLKCCNTVVPPRACAGRESRENSPAVRPIYLGIRDLANVFEAHDCAFIYRLFYLPPSDRQQQHAGRAGPQSRSNSSFMRFHPPGLARLGAAALVRSVTLCREDYVVSGGLRGDVHHILKERGRVPELSESQRLSTSRYRLATQARHKRPRRIRKMRGA